MTARARRGSAGVTLVEMMIAVALISVGILGFFGAFSYISKSLHVSRTHTLASNLAQEKIEILKNLGYYDLLITTNSATIPGFASDLYDTVNYPPETISISGINFTRYTYVTLAQLTNNVITGVSYTYPDTGMKEMTVYVVWSSGGESKIWSLSNLLENPSVAQLDSGFKGTVTQSGGGALAGAIVQTEEIPSWRATSASDGSYSFSVNHGSYTIRASSAGFYDAVSVLTSANAKSVATVNLALSPIATGTITGNAWFNPGIVISQLVGSTTTATASGQKDVEYIELFNPTTYTYSVATPNSGSSPWETSQVTEHVKMDVNWDGVANNLYEDIMNCGDCRYVSTSIAPGGYFLVANYSRFFVNGAWVNADAYYDGSSSNCGGATPADCIANYQMGAVKLYASPSNAVLDEVCWNGKDGPPSSSWCTGSDIPTDSSCGLNTGEPSATCNGTPYEGNQLVRFSSPTVLGRGSYGSAYNAKNNATDFQYPVSGSASTLGLNDSPFTTSQAALKVISGVPAVGAAVAAEDSYSGSTLAVAAYASGSVGNQLYAPFTLTGVTTGTWTVDIASGAYYQQVQSVAVSQNVPTSIPNATTTPAWPAANIASLVLSSASSGGFLKGTVTDANGTALSGIQVLADGNTKTTGPNGTYFAVTSTGSVTVIGNPNNVNPNYVQDEEMPTVTTGAVTTQNLVLSQGGSVQGFLTTGTTPLPDFLVVATLNGTEAGEASSNAAGVFTIANLSTGTYTIAPNVGSGQETSPVSLDATVDSGQTLWIGTFTVTGAFGAIAGTVTYNGAPVTSGALVIASTGTLTLPPSSVNGSSCTAQTPVYAVSTNADGTFNLPVRAANGYNMMVEMPTSVGGTVTIVSKTHSGVNVSASATTSENPSLP